MRKNLIILLLAMAACTPKPVADLPADPDVILPPSWAFGIMYGGYTNQKESTQRVEDIIAHDYPIDAYWIDSWFWDCEHRGNGPKGYLDFVGDTVAFPNRPAMWKHMQDRHIKGGFWIWNCILRDGNEEVFDAFNQKGYFKKVYENDNPWHNRSTTLNMYETRESHPATLCGDIDFSNPEAAAYFKQCLKPLFDEGADFLKLDRSNGLADCKVMFEASQELGLETKGRGFLLAHTGNTGNSESKRYPGRWSDDTRSDWSMDSPTREFESWVPKTCLKENILKYTDPARESSRIPFMAQDLGGYVVGTGTQKPEEQLYLRWMEFAMFCPLVEVFSIENNITANLAYGYSNKADSLFRALSHMRMQLFPYVYSSAWQARMEGKPMVRTSAHNVFDYCFGDSFLIAPVYEKDSFTRTVTLPEGGWINYWTGERTAGGKTVTVQAAEETIPLFVREGSIIPMRDYSSSVETGNNDHLTLHLYPGADGSFTLYEDDGISNDYLEGLFSRTRMELVSNADGCKLTVLPKEGGYDGEKGARRITAVLHLGDRTVTKETRYNKKRGTEIVFSL